MARCLVASVNTAFAQQQKIEMVKAVNTKIFVDGGMALASTLIKNDSFYRLHLPAKEDTIQITAFCLKAEKEATLNLHVPQLQQKLLGLYMRKDVYIVAQEKIFLFDQHGIWEFARRENNVAEFVQRIPVNYGFVNAALLNGKIYLLLHYNWHPESQTLKSAIIEVDCRTLKIDVAPFSYEDIYWTHQQERRGVSTASDNHIFITEIAHYRIYVFDASKKKVATLERDVFKNPDTSLAAINQVGRENLGVPKALMDNINNRPWLSKINRIAASPDGDLFVFYQMPDSKQEPPKPL